MYLIRLFQNWWRRRMFLGLTIHMTDTLCKCRPVATTMHLEKDGFYLECETCKISVQIPTKACSPRLDYTPRATFQKDREPPPVAGTVDTANVIPFPNLVK